MQFSDLNFSDADFSAPDYSNLSHRDFEFAGWERVAANYGRSFEAATRLFGSKVLDAAGVERGMRMLDVACGTGLLTSLAASRGALVAGADFSPAMIDVASRRYPTVEFHLAEAGALPFEDETFDGIFINFGINHFSEPVAALREARRLLKPGGRVVFTVWDASGEDSLHSLAVEAICAVGDPGPQPPGPPEGPVDNARECLRLLEAAGFDASSQRADDLEAPLRIDSPQVLLDMLAEGTVHTGALLRRFLPGRADELREAMKRATARYEVRGALKLPLKAVLASGTR